MKKNNTPCLTDMLILVVQTQSENYVCKKRVRLGRI